MKSEIALEDIDYFQKKYRENMENISIEKRIKELGIKRGSIRNQGSDILKFEFNIEVPDVKIYNQYNSYQCNIYAFLRVVKDILRKNTDLNVSELDLSSNYIHFFDQLEKSNSLYNDLIDCECLSLEKINAKVNQYIGSFGTFHFCREIVNKYGLVLTENMQEVNDCYDDFLVVELLKNKIKCDAVALIEARSKDDKIRMKKKLLYEVYQFLSKVYGEPPTSFEFHEKMVTPIQFKNTYIQNILDEYITVTSFSKKSFFDSYSFIPNLYLNASEKILSLPDEHITNAIICQLRDGVSVWFSAEVSTILDYDLNILDDQLYRFHELFNIKNVSKNHQIHLDLIQYDHAMCITGALVEGKVVKQFKVDNSLGEHGKYKGHLIMTPSFLKNRVITTIIHKKYLEDYEYK